MSHITSKFAATGADKCMHAALHLVGKHWPDLNYDDPAVWCSDDAAIVLLLENFKFLNEVVNYSWRVHSTYL